MLPAFVFLGSAGVALGGGLIAALLLKGADGTLRYRETIVDGIDRAPEAFIGMLEGANLGKMLVRVGPGP